MSAEALTGTYTVQQLAQLLNCSICHIRRLDAQRSIPGRLTFGRLVRFSRRQVDAWLGGEQLQVKAPLSPRR
jgi:excisionase family DNA binding protein